MYGLYRKIQTYGKSLPRNRIQAADAWVDILYMLSLDESLHEGDYNTYELAFDKGCGSNFCSRSLEMFLEKLQLGDMLFSRPFSISWKCPFYFKFFIGLDGYSSILCNSEYVFFYLVTFSFPS